jgi:cytosine/adenosine deaminase-related metal-dependent hydrolase
VRILSADWVVPVDGDPIRDGAVAIEDGLIAAVGTADELGQGDHHEDAVILPGFVNAHTHLEYAVYAGFGDGLSFAPWIGLHVERKERIDLGDMEAIARLGAFESLRSGVTTVGDCSFAGAAATACAELGLAAVVYLEVFGEPDGAYGLDSRFEPMRERVADAFSDEVRLGVSPHAPYTCSLELYRACADLGLPVATHLAESEDETRYVLSGEGPWSSIAHMLMEPLGTTGIRALAEEGLLGPGVLAAHCVQADDEEIELLASHDVAVAHCPRSNAYLGCGAAPLHALREAGVRVGIATDSPNSTPSFDMFDEIRAAVVTARARERRPDALTAADALELATLGGARALGLDSDRGSLTPGKRADLTVLSFAGSQLLPWEDPVTATVLGGAPERVVATLVSGQPRYSKGGKRWLELIDAAHSARARLLLPAGRTS